MSYYQNTGNIPPPYGNRVPMNNSQFGGPYPNSGGYVMNQPIYSNANTMPRTQFNQQYSSQPPGGIVYQNNLPPNQANMPGIGGYGSTYQQINPVSTVQPNQQSQAYYPPQIVYNQPMPTQQPVPSYMQHPMQMQQPIQMQHPMQMQQPRPMQMQQPIQMQQPRLMPMQQPRPMPMQQPMQMQQPRPMPMQQSIPQPRPMPIQQFASRPEPIPQSRFGPSPPLPGVIGPSHQVKPITYSYQQMPQQIPSQIPSQMPQQIPIQPSQLSEEPRKQTRRPPRPEKKEFYDVTIDNDVVTRLTDKEIIDHYFAVKESSYYGKNPAWLSISNQRIILLTENKNGGVYWPLGTTNKVRSEVSGFLKSWSKFIFQSTVENSTERYVLFEDKTDAVVLETLFDANKELKEYDTVYTTVKTNTLGIFNDECDAIMRFSSALSVCSQSTQAMFMWLLSAESILPIVKRQVRAFANQWSNVAIGSTVVDSFEMLDVVTPGDDANSYFEQVAAQIASFIFKNNLMKQYSGAIPLLDAYFYYGKASINDLKSPDDFMKACRLLTQDKVEQNHIYLSTIKGKQILCAESASYEKVESLIYESIRRNDGCVARNMLIKELSMPMGICDDFINQLENSGKIVIDSDSSDIFYYENAFVQVTTKTIV